MDRMFKEMCAAACEDPTSLGNLALEKGYVTPEKLQEALKVQEQRLMLGEILLELGFLTREQLDELVMEQKIRRGEIKDKKVIIDFEKKKMKSRLNGIKESFNKAGSSAEDLRNAFTAKAEALGK